MDRVERLNQRLDDGQIIVIDGGMGTELEARGVEMDPGAWCAIANVDRPGVVQEIHADFVSAGADVIITNTFPAGLPALEGAGHGDRFEEINRAAVQSALRAFELLTGTRGALSLTTALVEIGEAMQRDLGSGL